MNWWRSDAAAPTDNSNGTNGKDNSHHTTKDTLASILRDELKFSAKDSKRAVDTIFDTIVEVRSTACCVYSELPLGVSRRPMFLTEILVCASITLVPVIGMRDVSPKDYELPAIFGA